MAQLTKPNKLQVVTKEIAAKDGQCEISIALELTINLNIDGTTVTANVEKTEQKKPVAAPDMAWAIPEFGTGAKIKFGKD